MGTEKAGISLLCSHHQVLLSRAQHDNRVQRARSEWTDSLWIQFKEVTLLLDKDEQSQSITFHQEMQSLLPVYKEQHILIEEALFCSHGTEKFVLYYHKVINMLQE